MGKQFIDAANDGSVKHFNKNFLFNHRFQLQRNVDCKNFTAGIGSKRSVKSPRRWHMNGDDLDYATAEKTTSHERALESLVRFKAKLKRFAQHLPLRGFSVHKFPIIARALVKKLNFITISRVCLRRVFAGSCVSRALHDLENENFLN